MDAHHDSDRTDTTVRNDELERVLEAWNAATDRLQRTHEILREEVRRLTSELVIKNRELARKNRLANLGQVASHVAHEVRNGLAPVTLYLSLLGRRLGEDASSLSILKKLEAACTALEATVADLLNFASDREPEWGLTLVNELITEVCDALAPQLEAQRISVQIDVADGTLVSCDRQMMRRAVLNLVLNALDAMPDEGGLLLITCVETQQGFELEVADSGTGIDGTLRERVFEPFFTTKGEGTGLGLAIVYRIAEAHGGGVHAQNCAEGGAAITIQIPHRRLEAAA